MNNPTNLSQAKDLKEVVNDWVARTFNYIELDVYEIVLSHHGQDFWGVIEYPDEEDMRELFIAEEQSMVEDQAESFWQASENMEEYDTIEEFIEGEYGGYYDFVVTHMEGEFERFATEENEGLYPVWGTLFEIRDTYDSRRITSAAQNVGLGVIRDFGSFNTTLFSTSAGHSFYSDYWIPLYLQICSPEQAKRWEGVDYSMV